MASVSGSLDAPGRAGITRVGHVVRQHGEAIVLAAILLFSLVVPQGVPAGVYLLGVVFGGQFALQALGLLLVYRANRILNFAQVALGAVAGQLFFILVHVSPFEHAVRAACDTCQVTSTERTLFYLLSMALSLVVAGLTGWLAYVLVVRRFADAPRLMLTVATVSIAAAVGTVADRLPRWIVHGKDSYKLKSYYSVPAGFPLHLDIQVGPVHFGSAHVLTVAVAVGASLVLAAYLRKARSGVALRGAAENAARAGTLGVNVPAVTSVVWVMVGALSGFASMVSVMLTGQPNTGAVSPDLLVRALAALVIAGLANLRTAVIASFVIGIFDTTLFYAYSDHALSDLAFLIVITVVLLLQRSRASRAETAAEGAWRASREVRGVPRELMRVPEVRTWTRNLRIGAGVVVLGLPWVFSPSQAATTSTVMLYTLVALSLLVLTGWSGQISLGQWGFAAIGAWTTVVLIAHASFPYPLAIIGGCIAGAAVALAIGLPAIRLRGLHLAVSTLAFSLAAYSVLFTPRYLGHFLPSEIGAQSLLGLPFQDTRVRYYFLLALLIAVTAGVVGLRRSRFGRALLASRDNAEAAQSFGVSVVRLRLAAFGISGFIAALAGGVFAVVERGAEAGSFTPDFSISIFLIAVIGGLGSIAGPITGGLYFLVVALFASDVAVRTLFTGAGLLLVLLVVPAGISSVYFRVRDAVLRRVAIRRRIVVPALFTNPRAEIFERPRAAIAPKMRGGGATVFVPARYQLDEPLPTGAGPDV